MYECVGIDVGWKRQGREADKGMVPLCARGGFLYSDEVTAGCCSPLVLDC